MKNITFLSDIQTLRRKRGWSQSKLASSLGIRRDELSILENGHRLPNKDILKKLTQELECLNRQLYPQEIINLIEEQ